MLRSIPLHWRLIAGAVILVILAFLLTPLIPVAAVASAVFWVAIIIAILMGGYGLYLLFFGPPERPL